MKISICIPQFNRIYCLIKCLDCLQDQCYSDFEVVISDDCSRDDTTSVIHQYMKTSKYPITYFKFDENQGYDRNLRKSLELANGKYCLVLGNDDTLTHNEVLNQLRNFLIANDYPDIGFCNYQENSDPTKVVQRALETKILGFGPDVAISKFSCFSFVAGIIIKKSTFDQFNTSQFDKSIYAQIALALNMVCNGAVMFSIKESWVRKDITIENGGKSNSYLDFINQSYFKIKAADGGLKSVIHVLYQVLDQNQMLTPTRQN